MNECRCGICHASATTLYCTPSSNQRETALRVEAAMTLKQFLDATAGVPEPILRSAMVVALAVEPARTPEAYRRFYDRVVDGLRLDNVPPAERGGHWVETGGSVVGDCRQPPADRDRSDNVSGRCA